MHKVLVVDDEVAIRILIARWLEAVGYTVALAGSADEGLEEMGKDPAVVAVCDISMPERDGIWLAKQLRARHPDTALVMMTASQDIEPAIQCLRLAAVDYLLKPFARAQLHEAIARALEWHRNSVDVRRWRETQGGGS